MKHYSDEWVKEWCHENGWTDLFIERQDNYWAFPPGAVMPEPISGRILKGIKSAKGLSQQEKMWLSCAGVFSLLAIVFSYFLQCPMPIVLAFSFAAVTAVQLELED